MTPIYRRLWGDVKKFIETRADKHKSVLKVKWVMNSFPILKLKHSGGTETMRVDGWKVAQFEQFLEERVKNIK